MATKTKTTSGDAPTSKKAKRLTNVNLSTVTSRDRLPVREAIYWHKLDKGCHLGLRKMSAHSPGIWWARYYNTDTDERPKKQLGEFGHLPANERFSAAKQAAEKWFEHLGKGGSTKAMTVKEACAAYAKYLRATSGDSAADDVEGRFRRWVNDAPIGKVELSKLTMVKVENWRLALATTRAKVSRDNREIPLTRPRANSTLNRDMTALRSALNYALERKHLTSDEAWAKALKPIKKADGHRDLYLDREQRRALLNAAAPDIRTFLHCLSLVPIRPGAMAHLTCGKLDPRRSTLVIGKDKNGEDRTILLPPATLQVFAASAKGKPKEAPILTRADGAQWNKDSWKDPIKDAVGVAGLPPDTTAYTLRHSVITDLVIGGLNLATVATLAGTSVEMIVKHYAKLLQNHAAEALSKLDLGPEATTAEPPTPPVPPSAHPASIDYGDSHLI
ncbi:tyrosine-type recombinase/integrase [Kinneretia aquatilis]|uniref:tyrosine-type recombinase/integrase n=1 Tax=Kinneretia aquatilis TaxID=2070761 RepID=UPI00149526BA|nr:tyrosine-type recombinase/integrase [Paucibacter aquatile]WIV99694.1 tyrosine-type recombinase/integrase [Paucibacter aquatile]